MSPLPLTVDTKTQYHTHPQECMGLEGTARVPCTYGGFAVPRPSPTDASLLPSQKPPMKKVQFLICCSLTTEGFFKAEGFLVNRTMEWSRGK